MFAHNTTTLIAVFSTSWRFLNVLPAQSWHIAKMPSKHCQSKYRFPWRAVCTLVDSSTTPSAATVPSLPRCHVVRERLHIGIAQFVGHVGHRGHARTDAFAGFEIVQRLVEYVLALPRQTGGGAKAVVIVGVTGIAAVLKRRALALSCQGVRRYRGLGRSKRRIVGAEVA